MNITYTPLVFNPYQKWWAGAPFSVEIPLPDRCPNCDAVGYHYLVSLAQNPESPIQYDALFYCNGCHDFFQISYVDPLGTNDTELLVRKTYGSIQEETFSLSLSTLSPEFVETFHDAEAAERSHRLKIVGPGYRKALEYLVKDYAIHLHPEDEVNIGKIPLAQVIKEYIDHPQIQALSKGSSWLGNDHTHTVKKHESYTLADLKRFVIAVAKYIDLELTVEEAQTLLKSAK